MSLYWSALLTGITSFILSMLITPLVIHVAHKKGLIVTPRKDRWHKTPTALMGGIAIFLSFFLSFLIFQFQSIDWFILIACCIMFLTGLVDDFLEVKPIVKLLAQIICTFALIYQGFTFGSNLLSWASIPITFFWVIGITNAINLLDNMDGLSPGITSIISTVAGILLMANKQYYLGAMSFAIAGSCIGFLFYNFNPAKIFMGDSGSLFLGFSVAFLTLAIQKNISSSSSIVILLVPIALMAIPIMDTTLVTFKRLISGRRIDHGGRDHTSHRLVALGLSERKAVLTLYLISIAWGFLCLFMNKMDTSTLLLVMLLMTIFSIVFGITLSTVKVYNESEEKLAYLRSRGRAGKENNFFLRFLLMNKKVILGFVVDTLIICCSFFVAIKVTNAKLSNDYFVLALFIVIKIISFYVFNLYNRVWRYVSTFELFNHFLSIISGSLALFFLLEKIEIKSTLSSSFYIIDFFVTLTGIVFVRVIYRTLKEVFYKTRGLQKRALVYGAGDSGYLLMKEIAQNPKYGIRIVGWIDDDEGKHNMAINGIRILGSLDKIDTFINKKKAQLIIISSNSIPESKIALLRKKLINTDIEIGLFSLEIDFE